MSRFQKLLHLDQSILLYVRRWHLPWVTVAMKGLTRLADPTSFVVIGLALMASDTPNGLKMGLRLGAGALLATATTQLLKRVLKRNRPDVGINDFQALSQNPDAFSFPSGHTGAAVAVAVSLMGFDATLTATTLSLAFGVGFSRVYLGAHYPLDVIAGSLLGLGSGVVVRVLMP